MRAVHVRRWHPACGLGLGLGLCLCLRLSLCESAGLCLSLCLRLSLHQLCRRHASVRKGHWVGQSLLLGYADLRTDLRDWLRLLLSQSVGPRCPIRRWLLSLLWLALLLEQRLQNSI